MRGTGPRTQLEAAVTVGRSVGQSGLLGRERLSTTEPCSAVPASSALTRLSRCFGTFRDRCRTEHYSCTRISENVKVPPAPFS